MARSFAYHDIGGVWRRDRQTDARMLVSRTNEGGAGDGISRPSDISADGRYVLFWSSAPDLVADDTNESYDVFLFDAVSQTVTLVSAAVGGGSGNGDSGHGAISADGRFITFESAADDPNGSTTDVFLLDRESDVVVLVSHSIDGNGANGYSGDPAISADGQFVAFESVASDLSPDGDSESGDIFICVRSLQGISTRSLRP